MNTIKHLLLLFAISICIFSCSNIPDTTYYFSNWKEDKVELKEDLSEEDFGLISAWIYMLTNNERVKNNSIEGKTYRELFKIFKELKEKNEKISELENRMASMICWGASNNINNMIISMDLSNAEPYIKFLYNNKSYFHQSSLEEIDSFRDVEAILESSKSIEED